MTNPIDQPNRNPTPAAGPESSGGPGTHGPQAGGRKKDAPTLNGEVTGVPAVYTAPNRPRGLNAYFAPGGEDEATDERRADERRNLRLLLLMVVLLVGIPTILTIIAFVGQIVAKHGGG